MSELSELLRSNAREPWMTIGARPFAIEVAAALEAKDAEIKKLRAVLKEIAENSHDVKACAYAWSALMHMKRGADEQRMAGGINDRR